MNEQERFVAQRRAYFTRQGLSEDEADTLVELCLGVSARVGREFQTGIKEERGERLLCFFRPGTDPGEGVGVPLRQILGRPNPALVAPAVARLLGGVDPID